MANAANQAHVGKYRPLTPDEKKTLSSWIGYDWGDFQLLYRASRDRLMSNIFHQKCDNKGPTVTVIYASNGFVFGGYTSLSWNLAAPAYPADPTAFLFNLRSSTGNKRTKLAGSGSHGIHTGYPGPCFCNTSANAALTVLNSNNEIVLGEDGIFPQSGISVQVAYGYNSGTLDNNTLSGGATQMYDVEVYHVTEATLLPEDEAWRKLGKTFEWSPELLKAEIAKFSVPEELNVPFAKILLLGPVGAGKSSFFNTVNSVYRGHVTNQAPTMGAAKHSVTTKLRNYKIRQGSSDALAFRICDTMGVEEDGGLVIHDIPYILDGNVDDHIQFNPAAGITPSHADFKSGPKLKDKIHVAAIVLSAATVQSMSPGLQEKLKTINRMLLHRGVPMVALLTHIDEICPKVAKDSSLAFRSPLVLDAVSQTADITGIPRNGIMPVHNYENEISTDEARDTLTLLALRQMLRFASDYFNEQLDLMGK